MTETPDRSDRFDRSDRSDKPAKPQIDYPCTWEFRIIGSDEGAIRQAVTVVVAEREYQLEPTNRKGRFLSMSLKMVVESESQRDAVYEHLAAEPSIKMVL